MNCKQYNSVQDDDSYYPVTIKQFKTFDQQNLLKNQKLIVINGKKCGTFKILGVLQKIEQQPHKSKIALIINDWTGILEVLAYDIIKFDHNLLNQYIKCTFIVNSFKNKVILIAHRIDQIITYNEITNHFLRILIVQKNIANNEIISNERFEFTNIIQKQNQSYIESQINSQNQEITKNSFSQQNFQIHKNKFSLEDLLLETISLLQEQNYTSLEFINDWIKQNKGEEFNQQILKQTFDELEQQGKIFSPDGQEYKII